MPTNIRRISVFLSSPGDLAKERKIIDSVCEEINLDQGRHGNFVIDLLKWETHVRPSAGSSGQGVINQQIGVEYDIYLGMLGARFGSKTAEWGSGTEEEFRLAFESYKIRKLPLVLFYFLSRIPGDSSEDLDQFVNVRRFKSSLKELGVLYGVISDETTMRSKLHRDISSAVREILSQHPDLRAASDTSSSFLSDEAVFDPMKNWNELIVSNPEVAADALLSEAVDAMSSYTSEMKSLTAHVTKLTKDLTKSTRKLEGIDLERLAKNPDLPIMRRVLSTLNEVDPALKEYAKALLSHIPKLDASIQRSIIGAQRAVHVLVGSRKLTEVESSGLIAPLLGLSNSIGSIKEPVLALNLSIQSWPDTLPAMTLRKAQILALHADLIDFVKRTETLISEVIGEFQSQRS